MICLQTESRTDRQTDKADSGKKKANNKSNSTAESTQKKICETRDKIHTKSVKSGIILDFLNKLPNI